jgi:hypothetical protein
MIAEREVDGHTALVLRSEGPDGIEACFVPATGMVGCSLLDRGARRPDEVRGRALDDGHSAPPPLGEPDR